MRRLEGGCQDCRAATRWRLTILANDSISRVSKLVLMAESARAPLADLNGVEDAEEEHHLYA